MLFTTTGCSRFKSIVVAAAAALALPACTVEAGDEAAHAIAEKFAAESTEPESGATAHQPDEAATELAEAEPQIDAQRDADEAEMLARARAEAEARRKAEEARRLTEQAAKEQADRAAEARRRAENRERAAAARAAAEKAEAARRAEAQRESDEAEMLARARAEAEERRRTEQRRLRAAEVEKQRRALEAAEAERRRAAAQANRLAEIAAQEEARKAEEARRMAEQEQRKTAEYWRRFEEEQRRKAAEAKLRAEAAAQEDTRRAAEARRLATLRQLEEEARRKTEQAEAIAALAVAKEARKARAEQRDGEPFSSRHALGGPLPHEAVVSARKPVHPSRVTVLLVMDPGQRGIRRFNKTADPILCVGTRCYISEGPDEPARAMTRRGAFGPIVALGTRAGRCRNSLTCVFRGVDLDRAPAVVQPIDLKILRHDRREPRAAAADPTCRVEHERLTCNRPVLASDYKLWIVPESIAERAGSFALELAVRAGLPDESAVARAAYDRR